jgi:RNA polymerase sigma-70 factor (ECF subfamily)
LDGLSDEQLLVLARSGDHESFTALVGRWETPLYGLAFRFLGQSDEARDVCQETFLRVYRQADRFRDDAKFSTWLYQIALNLCRDIARRRRRWNRVVVPFPRRGNGHGEVEVEFAGPASAAADRGVMEDDDRRRVRAALASLPAEQREVIVMKEFQGLKFREIAEILGCPESTVKSRMYYGLAAMRPTPARAAPPAAGRSAS